MLWGAAEIALADEAAGAPAGQVRADLGVAARWARAYIAQGHSDTFNLYDTGAVAEAELIQAMRQAGDFPVPLVAVQVSVPDTNWLLFIVPLDWYATVSLSPLASVSTKTPWPVEALPVTSANSVATPSFSLKILKTYKRNTLHIGIALSGKS